LIACGKEGGEDVVGQVVHGLVVDVVLDLQKAVAPWVGAVDGVVPDVLAGLDLLRAVMEIALCVEVEVDDVVAESRQDALAVLLADGIGRPHVSGEETENGIKSNLVPDDLVRELRVGKLAGVLMGPCVARNLVTFGMHSLKPCFSMASPRNRNRNSYFDDCRIDGRGIIDLPLAEVVSRDEEGGFGTVALFFV
jgi:hypothetical protein